jgi:hypothetical protein
MLHLDFLVTIILITNRATSSRRMNRTTICFEEIQNHDPIPLRIV